VSNTCPTSVQIVSQKCPKSVQQVPNKSPKSLPTVSQKCPKSVPKVFQKCVYNLPTHLLVCFLHLIIPELEALSPLFRLSNPRWVAHVCAGPCMPCRKRPFPSHLHAMACMDLCTVLPLQAGTLQEMLQRMQQSPQCSIYPQSASS
jgi:hypothetical protein